VVGLALDLRVELHDLRVQAVEFVGVLCLHVGPTFACFFEFADALLDEPELAIGVGLLGPHACIEQRFLGRGLGFAAWRV